MLRTLKTKVYDLECLPNVFSGVFYDINTHHTHTFCISKFRDDRAAFYNAMLTKNLVLIGFNNVNYDYPLLHYFMAIYPKYKHVDADRFTEMMYRESQRIINSEWTAIKRPRIPQIDLYKIWHFDNKMKRTSLKWVQFHMKWKYLQDMPFDHTHVIQNIDELNLLLEYNVNDVISTYEFFLHTEEKINQRIGIKQEFGIPCLNYSDTKLGVESVITEYCNVTGADAYEVRKRRTYYDKIAFKDVIFPYIEFESDKLNNFLERTRNTVVYGTDDFKEVPLNYGGFNYMLGSGGIHGCTKPGWYKSDDEWIIIDVDVASLYPSIAIENNLYPAQLGPEFVQIYKDIRTRRFDAKKAGNKIVDNLLKLALNSVFGNSNSEYSAFYDLLYFYRTTLNGQLLLIMLAEKMVNNLESHLLQINTDGITIKIRRSDRDKFMKICTDWEEKTNLILEYVDFSDMIISHVNSYMSITTDGDVKLKGEFDWEKTMKGEPQYHKNNSKPIVGKAMIEYFLNGTPVEDTIKSSTDLFDFCIGRRARKAGSSFLHGTETQQKTIRYYVSTDGDKLVYKLVNRKQDKLEKAKEQNNQSSIFDFIPDVQKRTHQDNSVEAGYLTTIVNNIEDSAIVKNIDYNYYINECNKIIDKICA